MEKILNIYQLQKFLSLGDNHFDVPLSIEDVSKSNYVNNSTLLAAAIANGYGVKNAFCKKTALIKSKFDEKIIDVPYLTTSGFNAIIGELGLDFDLNQRAILCDSFQVKLSNDKEILNLNYPSLTRGLDKNILGSLMGISKNINAQNIKNSLVINNIHSSKATILAALIAQGYDCESIFVLNEIEVNSDEYIGTFNIPHLTNNGYYIIAENLGFEFESDEPDENTYRIENNTADEHFQSLKVNYNPSKLSHLVQNDAFPIVLTPEQNTIIKSHRNMSNKKSGIKDKWLGERIKFHFKKNFQVLLDSSIIIGYANSDFYEPDIALVDVESGLNIRIDIEVDEPYAIQSRMPIHYFGSDDVRNNFFIKRGWLVVRFSENQVHSNVDGCVLFLAKLLNKINPKFSIPTSLKSVKKLSTENCWTKADAINLEKKRFRENSLNIITTYIDDTRPSSILGDATEQEKFEEALITGGYHYKKLAVSSHSLDIIESSNVPTLENASDSKVLTTQDIEKSIGTVNWEKLSKNTDVDWNIDFIRKYKDKLHWLNLCKNEALPWSESFIDEFKDYLLVVPNYDPEYDSPNYIDYFDDVYKTPFNLILDQRLFRFGGIKKLHWSKPLINKYKTYWDWGLLSSNPNLPCSEDLIDSYIDKWSWYSLTRNKIFQNTYLISKYKDRLDWWQLSCNEALPWSESLIDEFEDYWNWEVLSYNEHLPWSAELIEKYADKWYWGGDVVQGYGIDEPYFKFSISSNTGINWTLDLVEKWKDKLHFYLLGDNKGVVWSEEMMSRFANRWVWGAEDSIGVDSLCRNQWIKWNNYLLYKFKDKIDWKVLSENFNIEWTPMMLEANKDRIHLDLILEHSDQNEIY